MSESPTPTTKKADAPASSDSAPTQVGRTQLGEAASGAATSRVPRGVGEAPSDALAEHEGLKATQEAVKKTVDADSKKGYRGAQADPTPNENYTVAGVTKGLPTPETAVYTPSSSK